MKRSVIIIGLVLIVPPIALLALALIRDGRSIEASPMIGVRAPDFELEQYPGNAKLSLASLRGKPVVLNFWATWCEPCKVEHPTLQRAAAALGERVHFVGVAFDDSPEAIGKFLAEGGQRYPILVDRGARTAIAYGVAGVPETFFIDAGGVIQAKHAGPVDAALMVKNVAKLFPREAP